ncbi:MAG: YIP1 family protein [Planctomycetota bacterium]|jgi:hypothetical protein
MSMPPPPPAPCRWHGNRAAVVGCSACGAPLCATCAVQILEPGAPAWAAACPTCAPGYQTASSVPLDDPAQGAVAWPATAAHALLRPGEFFNVFRPAPLKPAMVYAYVTGLPGAALTALFMWVGARAQAAMQQANPGQPLSPFGGTANDEQIRALLPVVQNLFAALPLVLWLFTPLALAVIAGAFHLAAKMAGGRAPFATTWRACAFLSPLWLVLAFSPLCCGPFWFAAYAFPMFHCFRRPHGLSGGQALGALALAAVFVGVLSCLLFSLTMCGGALWVGEAALPK